MKFIHIADVHLGLQPDAGKEWSQRRQKDIWESFFEVIQRTKELSADLLLIAGDLFHRQPLKRELKEVAAQFAAISDTQVVMIAGNHDYVHPKSYYRSFEWPDNVHVLIREQIEGIRLDEIDTTVWGCSFWKPEDERPVYTQAFPRQAGYHILLGHGGDEKHHPFSASQIEQAGYDYAAFGHIHKAEQLVPGKVVMSGALEPTDCNDFGPHGYWVGDLTERGCRLSFFPIKKCEYIRQEITVTPNMAGTEILEQVRQQEFQRLGMQDQLVEDEIGRLRIKLQENENAQSEEEAALKKADRVMQDTRIKWNPCILIGCAGFILISCFANMLPFSEVVYHILQILCGVLIVLGLILAMRRKKRETEENDRQQQFLKCHEMQAAAEVILQEIQEKEVQRANILSQQAEIQLASADEIAVERDKNAVVLAADTLKRLANELALESDDSLSEKMSAILSRITEGKYDALSLNERQKLTVTDQIYRRRPEVYSQATMQQMYFAYRMAAGALLSREEILPLMLDEAFAGYDEDRLKAVLLWLAEQDQQVFLFTCRHLEAEILQSEGIFYTEICI